MTSPQTRFDPFVADYARRGSGRTALTYHKLLRQFDEWLEERGLEDFDEPDVIEFMEGQKWNNSSRNLFLAALRGWARKTKGEIPSGTTLEEIQRGRDAEKRLDRIINIRGYKTRRKEKSALSLEQISVLFDAMDPDAASLFWVLLWFGFRVGELKLIKSVDWDTGKLTVETEKVGGSRTLFFDDYTARLLRHAQDRGLLDLSDIQVWKKFCRYSAVIAPAKLTPHLCRHTFATHFSGLTDEFTLKRMLGHGHRSATDIYVHRFDEQIREVMVERHYLKPLEPENVRSFDNSGGGDGA